MLWLLACGEGVQSVEDTAAETVVEETELSSKLRSGTVCAIACNEENNG